MLHQTFLNTEYSLRMCYNSFGDSIERRIAKLIVGKSGVTAGKDSKTYKASLPSKWVAELGLTDSKMEMEFDGERNIISLHLSIGEFLEKKKYSVIN